MYNKSYQAQQNRGTVPNMGQWRIRWSLPSTSDSATMMNTEVVDYTNFDGHTYRFASTSKKENESKYLCNKYRLAGETALWGTRRQSMNGGGTTPGERCPGTLIVQHEFGMSGGDHPYIKVEHKCVDNREVTSAVARGVKDDRPQLERISPNIKYEVRNTTVL